MAKRTPSRHPNGSRHCHRQSPYYHYAPFTYTTSPPTPLSCIFSPSPFTYTTFPPTLLRFPTTPFTHITFPHTLLNSSPTPISYATFPPSPLSYATSPTTLLHYPPTTLSFTTSPPQGNSPPKKSIRQTSFAPLRFFRKEFSSFNTSSISPRNSPTQNPIHP